MPDVHQDHASHARIVPGYHYVLASLLVVVFGWQLFLLFRHPGLPALIGVAFAVALVLIAWYVRAFAVTVQDRVIRLEERLRMERLLPADLQGRVGEFTPRQLVALRFASDQELPALARRVLEEGITDPKAIKAAIREWRPDHLRA